jgi:membrane protein YdbS with pleckstrin-like domain
MGYPDKLLNPGEQVAVDVVPHWKFMAGPVLVVVLVLAGAIVALQFQPPRWAELALAGLMVLSLIWLVERYLRWVTTSFVVTNQRLILRKGVLRRSGREILLDRLSDITYKQTLSDRLLRCGDILLESPGREGQEVVEDVPRAIRIQNEICRLVSQRQSTQAPPANWPTHVSFTGSPVSGNPVSGNPVSGGPVSGSPFSGSPVSGSPVSGSFTEAASSSGELARSTVTGSGRIYVGPAPSEVTTGPLNEPTVAEQLTQLDDLRRRGVISRREFAAKKSELLSRM